MSRTIVITGSTRGLGLETAIACLQQGANVIISSENATELDNTLAELKGHYSQVRAVLCDVSQAKEIAALAQFASDEFGVIDCWNQ